MFDSANHWLATLWKCSWQASILVVFVVSAQRIFAGRLAPRWRSALWLLVALRLALPWSIPVALRFSTLLPLAGTSQIFADRSAEVQEPRPARSATPEIHVPSLFIVWAIGAVYLASYLTISNWRFARKIALRRPLINEPLLNLLEDCKGTMRVRTPITLLETDDVGSPSLFGVIRPRLLLPRGLVNTFSRDEMRFVFLHELAHVKRLDILAGWLAAFLQCLHWFNPFVWLAFHRMRREREVACDALVLSCAVENENQTYGAVILRLLENFGRSTWAPSLAGALENIDHLKERMKMIALFKNSKSTPVLAVALFAVFGLVAFTEAKDEPASAGSSDSPKIPPHLVATSPSIGATEIDPATSEISVTFDQDMQGGMSWTGGGAELPHMADGKKAHWIDKRTCVLPVKLYGAHYYRIGINSDSYQNFRGVNGVAVEPMAIYFTTQGASADLKAKLQIPQIVSMSPANGAHNVSPETTELRVTFNEAMGPDFSWTGGGADFPAIPEGKHVRWIDEKTCSMPVTLQPGTHYRLGINSRSFKNFQSKGGIPVVPVVYTFDTAGN